MKTLWPRTSSVLFAACMLASCNDKPSEILESFAEKREWSVLQGLEYESRGKPVAAPVVRKVEEYEVLAVASLDRSTTIWILLRPESPPYYKQMPDGNYAVPEALVNELVVGKRVSATVESALRSHLATK